MSLFLLPKRNKSSILHTKIYAQESKRERKRNCQSIDYMCVDGVIKIDLLPDTLSGTRSITLTVDMQYICIRMCVYIYITSLSLK